MAAIVIDLPKKWDTRFQQSVEFKRVARATTVLPDMPEPEPEPEPENPDVV